ncbi:unnamed protein product [Euphydryas editha]|uniref:Endonuclease/exonuclease/phosphatase domain-containing protein n=1 Tax=Euphydryas editha TaxID=104508 RepID=A0AAU9UJP8_EUPED|nr:unnamed protein product [Euphydryas editha]
MLQIGKMSEIAHEMCRYNVDLIALQEVRWQGSGTITKSDYTVYYSCAEKQGAYGTGFMISKKIKECVLGFEPVNERMCKLRIKGKLYNTTYICTYAPTEDATDEYKETFYEDLQNLCNKVPKYDALCVIGDFNAKVGKEDIYSGVIGKESLHEKSSDNDERICNFVVANNLFICGTKFPHKDVHKGT